MNSVIEHASLPRRFPVLTRPADLLGAVGGVRAVAAAGALVGLAAAVDPAGARPFTSLRWAVVSATVCIAAVATGRWALPRWLLATWAVLVAAMTIGAATGPDPVTAWLGHPQRHLGVFAWVVFAVATAAGAGLARQRQAVRTVELVTVVVAGNVAATSIADGLGWDPAGASFADGRVGGVFGQPVVLATVAVLLLPVVVASRRVGPVRWPITVGLLVTIGLTQTRGALLGLAAVAAVTAPTWWPAVRRTASSASRWAAAGAVVAGMALLAVSPLGDRLADSVDSSRTDEWAVGLAVVADDPVVGVGPEGYRIAALDHLDDSYVERYGRDVVVDRAHNAPLDVAASGGVVAGAAYLALVGAVAVTTWRRQRPNSRGWTGSPTSRASPRPVAAPVAVAAGAGAVGVFAAGLVAFPVAEVDAVAWLFAGVALASPSRAVAPNERRRSDPLRSRRARTSRPDRALASGVRVVAALCAAVAVVAGVTDVVADHRLGDALAAAGIGRTEPAVDAAERAIDLRPDLIDAHYVAATAAATGPTILDVDRAIDFAAAGIDRFPRDPALRDLHANLLVDRAVRSGLAADTAAATAALDALERDDPTSLVAQSGTDLLIAACLIRCENKP